MTIAPPPRSALGRTVATLRAALVWPLRQMLRPLARAKLVSHRLIGVLVEFGGNRVTTHGLRFSVDSLLITRRQKGMLDLGLHESAEIELARRHLDFSLPVVELGAGIGVVSCTVNRLLTRREAHLVVEANPSLIDLLEVNRGLTGSRYSIRHAALGYGSDEVELAIDTFVSSRVGGEGQRVRIQTISLAALLEETGFQSVNLIVDIEGSEVDLVEHEAPLLAGRVRVFIVETHPRITGAEAVARMLARLRALGFAELARVRDVYAFGRRASGPPPPER